jgi:hypothetical protein
MNAYDTHGEVKGESRLQCACFNAEAFVVPIPPVPHHFELPRAERPRVAATALTNFAVIRQLADRKPFLFQ